MAKQLLHKHPQFKGLINIISVEMNIAPVLVEKDYWMMHALWGLLKQDFKIELKGGTSLSKGYGIIHRFSEDLDIKIEPLPNEKVSTGKNHNDQKHIQSRREFFERLAKEISIPDMTVRRDSEFDDIEKVRNVGIRLEYESFFGGASGLKEGVLLEVGFDTTQPSQLCDISSWVLDRAQKLNVEVSDNRALKVSCYHPGYTFVEKLQTILSKFNQYKAGKGLKKNFLRHYYDVYQLLERDDVRAFIGTQEYRTHKKVRFGVIDHDISRSEAFKLSDAKDFAAFEKQYKSTDILYFKGQPSLEEILSRIQKCLAAL